MIKEDEYLLKCKNWPHAIGYSDKDPEKHIYYFHDEENVFMVQIPKIQPYVSKENESL